MNSEPDSSWLLDFRRAGSMLEFELVAVRSGRTRVAGVDEVGRGPLAGPLVAAAVLLAHPIQDIDDSKKLTEAAREALFAEITGGPHRYAVDIVEPAEIDRLGLQQANYLAMKRAAEALSPLPDFLLVDGFEISGCAIPQVSLVKGDARAQSIAAASIVAKVTRDRIMCEFAQVHPDYGFDHHKGYATRAHLDALERHGPCPIHRRTFAPIATRDESGVLFT